MERKERGAIEEGWKRFPLSCELETNNGRIAEWIANGELAAPQSLSRDREFADKGAEDGGWQSCVDSLRTFANEVCQMADAGSAYSALAGAC